MIVDPTSPEYERAVAERWRRRDTAIRSFWQSPIVNAQINRRVSGDPQRTPPRHFVERYCATPRARALSLGCGGGELERELVALGACERMVAVDISPERVAGAREATSPQLRERIEYVCANLETWEPPGAFDLIVGKGFLHHVEGIERMLELILEHLTDDGVLYVQEFVGPSRFQWSDKQLEIVNRLLDCLSEDLRRDLVDPAGGPKARAGRPSVEAMIADDPSEAARSDELPGLLRSHFRVLEEREWGGAIFHLLFSRIMGNFVDHDDLVRVIMELDAILTEEGVVGNDCLFGVYAKPLPSEPSDNGRAPAGSSDNGRAPAGTSGPRAQRLRSGIRRGVAAASSEQAANTGGSAMNGVIETVADGRLKGWVLHRNDPQRHVSLDVFVDNKLVRKAVADLPRSDLTGPKLGDGAHGFSVQLPTHALDGRPHYLAAAARGDGFGVPLAEDWEQCCVAQPSGTRFAPMRYDPHPPDLPDPRVLEGQDGWAFLCDDANGNLDQLLGELRFTASDLRDYRAILERRSHELERLGIPYIFAVAPSKEAIHPERLPQTTPLVGPPQTARQLLDYLSESEVRTVDLHAVLRPRALAGEELYYRRDAHWTYDGAYHAALALLEAVRAAGVQAQSPAPQNLTWVPERFVGDLADKPAVALIDGRLQEVAQAVPAGTEEVARRPGYGSLGLRQLGVPPQLEVSPTRPTVVLENHLAPRAPRALVYRDSSARWTLPFLASAFSWSAWLWRPTLDFELIARERPDVVVQIVTERFLLRVPYGDTPAGAEMSSDPAAAGTAS
jgi:SAM-dependent methyltransferase